MGARAVGPWVGEQKPLGKSPLQGNPSPESTYLPTWSLPVKIEPVKASPSFAEVQIVCSGLCV